MAGLWSDTQVAIGHAAIATGMSSVAIGMDARVSHDYQVCIGVPDRPLTERREATLNGWHFFDDGTVQFKNGLRTSIAVLEQLQDWNFYDDGCVSFQDGPRLDINMLKHLPQMFHDLYHPDGLLAVRIARSAEQK